MPSYVVLGQLTARMMERGLLQRSPGPIWGYRAVLAPAQ